MHNSLGGVVVCVGALFTPWIDKMLSQTLAFYREILQYIISLKQT